MTIGRADSLLLLASLALLPSLAAAAEIFSARLVTERPVQYRRTDFSVELSAAYGDPFDQREVTLDLVVRAPSGHVLVQPCFFVSGDPARSQWSARFAPQEPGDYRFHFRLGERGVTKAETAEAGFSAGRGEGDGFLHAGDNWVFRCDSGRPFRGLGENVCWEARTWEDPKYTFDLLLPELAANGADFFRVWMCPWNLPVEWKRVADTQRYADSPEHFNPLGARRMDEFVALAESLGLRFMLALDWHGALMTSDKWSHQNYNRANGGPAATPEEFFTNAEARAMYKNRLRYLIARWGCSTSLAVWEFFNEIDNTVFPEKIPHAVVTAWHDEMSRYLKETDPYGRLVTTSVSHRDIDGLNAVPGLDFNQRHIYIRTGEIPTTIARYVAATGKPYVIGEVGFDWDWNKITHDRGPDFDYHYKRALWYGLFSPTPILPMSWWWEFFHERKMPPYLRQVRQVRDRMMAAGAGKFALVASEAPGLESYAVRCGVSVFVYLLNDGTAPAALALTLAEPVAPAAVEVLDPGTGRWSAAAEVQRSDRGVRVTGPALAPREERILILTPNSARP